MAVQNSSELIVQESEYDMASHYISPQEIWNLFYGIFAGNEYACAGALGNMECESGFYSDNAENEWNKKTGHSDAWLTQGINDGDIDLTEFLQRDWYVNKWGFGYGLSQWTDSTRRTRLWDYTIGSGADIDDKQAQFSYIEWEWLSSQSPYHKHLDNMRSMTSVMAATRYYCDKYEVGSWSYTRYENADKWYRAFAGQSGQYHIYVSYTGNGVAYATPTSGDIGESFVLKCTPYDEDVLVDIVAYEEHGWSYALSVTEEQTLPFINSDVWIEVTFSGETPPVPPVPTEVLKKKMPIWMYPTLRIRRY